MILVFWLATCFLISGIEADCFASKDTGNSDCGKTGARKFYFHKQTRTCQPFFYQGCDGNDNRYDSKKECESACKNASAPGEESYSLCSSGAYPAGATSGSLVKDCKKCPHGYECEKKQCCPTREFTCALQYDAGKFGASGRHTPRYFFNKNYKNCMLFTFYGRDGNANNFATYNECKNFCM